MALTIENVLETEELRVRWLPGSSRAMVVAFMGIQQQFGGQRPDEFAGSAHAKGRNNVLFITDLKESWYSRPGLWPQIVRIIRDIMRVEGIEEVVTIGNSMGGYGALLLPRDIQVRRAVAFSPQISMDMNVIDEDRWMRSRDNFGPLPESNLADTIDATKTFYFVTCGQGEPRDIAQLDLLPEHKRIHRWVLPQSKHNIAGKLKEAGLLHRAVAAMMRGRKPAVDQIYEEYRALQNAPQPKEISP